MEKGIHEGKRTANQLIPSSAPLLPYTGSQRPLHPRVPGSARIIQSLTAWKEKDGGGQREDKTEPAHRWERSLMQQEPGPGMASSFHVGHLLLKE